MSLYLGYPQQVATATDNLGQVLKGAGVPIFRTNMVILHRVNQSKYCSCIAI